jgi:hypothetical protein
MVDNSKKNSFDIPLDLKIECGTVIDNEGQVRKNKQA